jgi:hypothetical protein
MIYCTQQLGGTFIRKFTWKPFEVLPKGKATLVEPEDRQPLLQNIVHPRRRATVMKHSNPYQLLAAFLHLHIGTTIVRRHTK